MLAIYEMLWDLFWPHSLHDHLFETIFTSRGMDGDQCHPLLGGSSQSVSGQDHPPFISHLGHLEGLPPNTTGPAAPLPSYHGYSTCPDVPPRNSQPYDQGLTIGFPLMPAFKPLILTGLYVRRVGWLASKSLLRERNLELTQQVSIRTYRWYPGHVDGRNPARPGMCKAL